MSLFDDLEDLPDHPLSKAVLQELQMDWYDHGAIGFSSPDQRIAYEDYCRRNGDDPYPRDTLASRRRETAESHWCACGGVIGEDTPFVGTVDENGRITVLGPRQCIRCYERAHPQDPSDA